MENKTTQLDDLQMILQVVCTRIEAIDQNVANLRIKQKDGSVSLIQMELDQVVNQLATNNEQLQEGLSLHSRSIDQRLEEMKETVTIQIKSKLHNQSIFSDFYKNILLASFSILLLLLLLLIGLIIQFKKKSVPSTDEAALIKYQFLQTLNQVKVKQAIRYTDSLYKRLGKDSFQLLAQSQIN